MSASATLSPPNHQATFWLLIWMANNLGVTLVNKACFSSVDFRYPYFLSAIHMVCNTVGAYAMIYASKLANANRKAIHSGHENNDTSSNGTTISSSNGTNNELTATSSSSNAIWNWVVLHILGGNADTTISRKVLDAHGQRLILAFSVIFSANIAIGNVSLKHVSVNFNQVMRSLVPAITIVFAYCLHKPVSREKLQSVVPIVIGVAMSCFGDMSYTATGFVVTVICIVLAALKVVASGEMLTGALKLHPVDLLSHMAPLALVQCLVAALLQGEVHKIWQRWPTELSPFVNPYPMAVVWFSGLLSFSLNICSLQANKVTSPLTLCIAANVKQVLMIAFSTMMFGTVISPLNGAGIVVVLIASAWYSYISVLEENAAKLQKQRALKSVESDLHAEDDDDDIEIGNGNNNNLETEALLDNSIDRNHAASMTHRK